MHSAVMKALYATLQAVHTDKISYTLHQELTLAHIYFRNTSFFTLFTSLKTYQSWQCSLCNFCPLNVFACTQCTYNFSPINTNK